MHETHHLLLCWTREDHRPVERMLIANGFRVEVTRDIPAALRMLIGMHRIKHPYAVVFTDCYDLPRVIRSSSEVKDRTIPVVYQAASANTDANLADAIVLPGIPVDLTATLLRSIIRDPTFASEDTD